MGRRTVQRSTMIKSKKHANWLGMWPHVATLNIVPGTGPYQFRWIRISPGCWILVADSSPGRVEEAAGKGFACWPEAVGFVPGNNHDSQGLLWTNFLCQVFTMYQLENSHGTHFMEVRNMTFPWQMVDFKVTLSIYIDIYIYRSARGSAPVLAQCLQAALFHEAWAGGRGRCSDQC